MNGDAMIGIGITGVAGGLVVGTACFIVGWSTPIPIASQWISVLLIIAGIKINSRQMTVEERILGCDLK